MMIPKRVSPAKRRGVLAAGLPALAGFAASLAVGYAVLTAGVGGSPAVAAAHSGATPAVIELFTSQGCYSCPPAEKLLGELVESADPSQLVALEFHVDYWDSLVYGRHGSHKDPFSSPANTLRQRVYNQQSLSGQTGVYTPQMVVNGRHGAVGSRRGDVLDGINRVERPEVAVDVTANGDLLSVALDGDLDQLPSDATLWLAVFDIEATTDVETGENHDKTLTSHHIVRSFESVSPVRAAVEVPVALGAGQGCALLVQSPDLGPIHAAAYCPDAVWRR